VIPALIRKCVEACQADRSSITCWGSGAASREFLYVDDAAEGVVAAAERIDEPLPINLGTGAEIRISDLVETIARLAGFRGAIEWDASKPDGQPRRCLDITRARDLLGWVPTVGFEDGLKRTIASYLEQHACRAA
jgi:GDP-L-fucose synthase